MHILCYIINAYIICAYAHITFTESQNHRVLGVGRDLCGSSSPTSLPEQGLRIDIYDKVYILSYV